MTNDAIIINYNDSKRVISLVNKLSSFGFFSDIVIVDNCSTEENQSALKKEKFSSNVHLILNPKNAGFIQALDTGARFFSNSEDDVLMAINSDVDVSKTTLISLASFLSEHKNYGAVSCRMIEKNEEKPMYYDFPTLRFEILNDLGLVKAFRIKPTIREKHEDFIRVDFVRSSLIAFSLAALKKADFFDRGTFLYFGEAIMGIKLQRYGYKEACLLKPEYYHNHIYKKGYKENGYRMNYQDSLYLFHHYFRISRFGFLRLKIAYLIGYLIRLVFGVFR